MQPFYQGKIDTFCAVYAVLNALQIVHGITPGQARELFNEVLVYESRSEARFRAVLTHRTDYVDMVDHMLGMVSSRFPLRALAPFTPGTPHAEVWRALAGYAAPEARRSAVFRFRRYVPPREAPVVDHWTTAHTMDDAGLHLFDSSLEPSGVYCLKGDTLADRPGLHHREYFVIPPECVRLISLP